MLGLVTNLIICIGVFQSSMVQFGQLISSTICYEPSSKCCRAPCSSPIDAQKLANVGTATSHEEHADEIWIADDVVSPTGLAVDRNVWMLGEGVCSFCSRETKALQA